MTNVAAPSDAGDTSAQLLRAVTGLKELRSRLEQAESARTAPIAIIGMGCRLPGAANPQALWELLRSGGDAIRETPAGRWDAVALYNPAAEAAGGVATRWGGFLDGIDRFDAAFFGISPREAAHLDPQQRLLLEVAWEALDDGGQAADRLAGSATGVFVGVHSHSADYYAMQAADVRRLDQYSGTGTSHSVVSGRLSYLLDLRGPSIAVDTACSSSLVAVHLAVQSLRSGESSLAIVGGVNSIIDPTFTMVASRMRMMSASGRCRPFDAGADGFVRSEGCAVVLLKRLADAVIDGDRVLAVIHGSAVNQDGRTNGLTAPNSLSQQAVIRDALANAGISSRRIGLIEAHGTGTPLGDPIEIEALTDVFSANASAAADADERDPTAPCALGSVKANIGHTEGAAGVASLIKTVLSLRAGEIPPLGHFERLNPHITLDGTPFFVPTQLQPWLAGHDERVAGVSSFGWSGTNAHVVVGEAPTAASHERGPGAAVDRGPFVLPISARDQSARRELALVYRSLLARPESASPAVAGAICATAGRRRSHHSHRLAVVGRDRDELIEQLDGFAAGHERRGLTVGAVEPGRRDLLVFVFSGQGSQWRGMARQLLATEPAFAAAIERCALAMAPFVEWSLVEQLTGDGDGRAAAGNEIEDIAVVQPTLFAIQVALAALWSARGVQPDAVVGHSMGEVAAAHVAGILSLDDAARIICRRSQLLRRISGKGAMAVVGLGTAQARAAIAARRDELAVAVSNSHTSTVLSGDPEALAAVMAELELRDVFCRLVKVDVASHSAQVDALHDDLVAAFDAVRPSAGTVPFVSTVAARFVDGAELDAHYWAQNVREPVLFADAVEQLVESSHTRFVELSPHPVLMSAVDEALFRLGRRGATIASMRRDQDELPVMAEAVGALYAAGHPIDWTLIQPECQPVDLPMYPWQRERHWLDVDAAAVGALDESVYTIEWRQDVADGEPDDTAVRRWLILADAAGHGDAIAATLRRDGARCIAIRRGDEFSCRSADEFTVRGREPGDLRHVLQTLEDAAVDGLDDVPDTAVLYLWALDSSSADPGDIVQLERVAEESCNGLIGLIAAIGQPARRLPVWAVTQGVHRVRPADECNAVAQSPLWGLCRAIGEEQPDLFGGIIDLEPGEPHATAPALAVELQRRRRGRVPETEVALRGGQRFVARLVRQPAPVAAPPRFAVDGSCLVTGAFGAVGARLTQWLVDQGARRLVLLGRTELPPRAAWTVIDPDTPAGRRVALVRLLERRGAAVHVASVDVGDSEALRAYLTQFAAEGRPPIRSVFHAAGVLGGQLLDDLDPAALPGMLRPKMVGAWTLSEALDDLDHFVLFSSVAALLPTPGHAAYAAANSFLDALAHQRLARGMCALSVNWGVWEGSAELLAGEAGQRRDAGERSYKETADRLGRAQAMHGFSTADGLAVLGRLMAGDAVQAIVVPVDWSEFAAARRARPLSLVADQIVAIGGARRQRDGHGERTELAERLVTVAADERRDLVDAVLREMVAGILHLPASRIDSRQPFGSLGLDSLMSVELRNRLEAETGLPLSATVAFNFPTLDELSGHVLTRLGATPATLTAQSATETATTARTPSHSGAADVRGVVAAVTDLSEAEVLAALMGTVET